MGKLIRTAVVVACVAVPVSAALVMPAAADTATGNPVCSGTEVVPGSGISVTQPAPPAMGSTRSGTMQVCQENSQAPYTGTVTASGSGGASGATGYLVVNGNSTNTGPMVGYEGVQGALSTSQPSTSNAQVVGCGAQGNYEPGGNPNGPPGPQANPSDPYGSDHAILSATDPTAPSTSGQCEFLTPVAPV